MIIRVVPFLSLIRQEIYRFSRLVKQTVFPPIITTILFIVIFGYSLGSRIKEISGFPYIIFIVPGLIALGVVTNSFANTNSSVFMARFDKSMDNLMAAPLHPTELVLAYIIGGIVRAFLIGSLTLMVAYFLIDLPIVNPVLLILFVLGMSIIFSSAGIIGALCSNSWDTQATAINFILTPLIYLGGVFYSTELLPPIWQKISLANPLFYMIDGMRFSLLGKSDVSWVFSIGLTWGCALALFFTCVYLFRIGFRLVK